MAGKEVCSYSMDSALISEQNVPSARLLSIKFEMMTCVEMEKSSNFIVMEASDLTKPKLGLPNPLGECLTCGGASSKQCDGHVGIIKFPATIFHPHFVQEIAQMLNQICPGCKAMRQNLQTKNTISPKQAFLEGQPSCKYCAGFSYEWYPAMKFKILKDKSSRGSILVEVNEKLPRRFKNEDLCKALPKDYWDFIPKDPQLEEFPRMTKVTLAPSQVFYLLKELDREFIEQYVLRREFLFLSCLPVTPNCHRVTEIHIGSCPKVVFDDRTKAYKRLVDSKKKVDECQQQYPSEVITSRVLECLSFSKLHPKGSVRRGSTSSVSGLRWIKDVVLCKRTDHVCRMTVNLFEHRQRSLVAEHTFSLALSKKLGIWAYGYEYAALEVQKHLERVVLSDVVSTVLIFYSGKDVKAGTSSWITHFHVNKEKLLKHRLKMKSITDVLSKGYKSTAEKLNTMLPKLHISSRCCSLDDLHVEQDKENCITVTAENCESLIELDIMQDKMIPVLLQTVVKGIPEVKKVDILWEDQCSRGSYKCSSGLFLKVLLSENCESGKGWIVLQSACIPVMDLIDWESSHPDNSFDISKAYGIGAAWKYFVGNLKATTFSIGKAMHATHLHLVADCLSVTGEFQALNAKGIKLQREQLSISSPFIQGFFSAPDKRFINAAKEGALDQLLGTVDALAWGKFVPLGTGGPFKLFYSVKVQNLDKHESIYGCLKRQCIYQRDAKDDKTLPHQNLSKKCANDFMRTLVPNGQLEMNGYIGCNAIPVLTHLVTSLRNILHKYPMDAYLNEEDKSLVVRALTFHPKRDAKIGIGIKDIKIGRSPKYPESRCYILERMDGTADDFSYRKCVKHAFEQYSPEIISRLNGSSGKSNFV